MFARGRCREMVRHLGNADAAEQQHSPHKTRRMARDSHIRQPYVGKTPARAMTTSIWLRLRGRRETGWSKGACRRRFTGVEKSKNMFALRNAKVIYGAEICHPQNRGVGQSQPRSKVKNATKNRKKMSQGVN